MFAEASCTSQIETARAVASELGPAGARTSGLDKWANIRDQNSERDAHNVIREQRLTLPIKLDWMSLESLRLPWISPRSWLSYLVKHGLWCRLCGLDQSQAHLCGPTWQQFWDNYRKLYPNFHLFSLPGLDLSKIAAVYIQGDEGRTLKRNAFMVTTLQSALGFGSQPQDRAHGVDAAADNSIRLKLNNVGSTFLTQLATLMIPKTLYDADDTQDVYLSMLEVLGQDLDQLLMDGVTGSDGASYRICVIGIKGDLPYLTRVSCSERAWNRASKGRGDGSQNRASAIYALPGSTASKPSRLGGDSHDGCQPCLRCCHGSRSQSHRSPNGLVGMPPFTSSIGEEFLGKRNSALHEPARVRSILDISTLWAHDGVILALLPPAQNATPCQENPSRLGVLWRSGWCERLLDEGGSNHSPFPLA